MCQIMRLKTRLVLEEFGDRRETRGRPPQGVYGPVLTTVVRFANEKRHNVMLILVALETTHAQNPAVKDIRPTTSSLNSEIIFCP